MFVNRIILRCSISKERCRFRATSLLYHRFWLLQVAAVIFFHELSGAVSRLWFPKRLAAQFLTLASPFSFASQPGDFFSAECLGWEIGVKISEELSAIWRTKT